MVWNVYDNSKKVLKFFCIIQRMKVGSKLQQKNVVRIVWNELEISIVFSKSFYDDDDAMAFENKSQLRTQIVFTLKIKRLLGKKVEYESNIILRSVNQLKARVKLKPLHVFW